MIPPGHFRDAGARDISARQRTRSPKMDYCRNEVKQPRRRSDMRDAPNQQGADIAFRPTFSGANNIIEDNFCLISTERRPRNRSLSQYPC